MNKRLHNKYILTLCIFVIVFLFTMTYMIYKIHDLTNMYSYRSVSSRLESMESDEEYGNAIASELYYDNNYEPEFDRFWDYAKVETAYIDGMMLKRAIAEGDTSKQAQLDECITQINNYIDSTDSSYFRNYAKAYLNTLQE